LSKSIVRKYRILAKCPRNLGELKMDNNQKAIRALRKQNKALTGVSTTASTSMGATPNFSSVDRGGPSVGAIKSHHLAILRYLWFLKEKGIDPTYLGITIWYYKIHLKHNRGRKRAPENIWDLWDKIGEQDIKNGLSIKDKDSEQRKLLNKKGHIKKYIDTICSVGYIKQPQYIVGSEHGEHTFRIVFELIGENRCKQMINKNPGTTSGTTQAPPEHHLSTTQAPQCTCTGTGILSIYTAETNITDKKPTQDQNKDNMGRRGFEMAKYVSQIFGEKFMIASKVPIDATQSDLIKWATMLSGVDDDIKSSILFSIDGCLSNPWVIDVLFPMGGDKVLSHLIKYPSKYIASRATKEEPKKQEVDVGWAGTLVDEAWLNKATKEERSKVYGISYTYPEGNMIAVEALREISVPLKSGVTSK